MNTKLKHVQDWPERARQAKWSASALAKLSGVCVRTLHRYFLKKMGVNTKIWLAEQRLHKALDLLRDGSSIKETSTALGYKEPGSFTRRYKNQMGSWRRLMERAGERNHSGMNILTKT